jgi:hypothetical protein
VLCLIVCDVETTTRRSRPELGCCASEEEDLESVIFRIITAVTEGYYRLLGRTCNAAYFGTYGPTFWRNLPPLLQHYLSRNNAI